MDTTELYKMLEGYKAQLKTATNDERIEIDIAIGELEAAIMVNETEDFQYETLTNRSNPLNI
jgi:hypothetical protein